MMRETGFVGLFRVIFECVRDGYGSARAWQVMAGFALLFALPFLLIAGIVWLVTLIF